MQDEKHSNLGSKVALGAAIAAGAGYLAGILTAPKSGKDTRNDIKQTAGNAVDDAERRIEQLRTEIDELIGEAKAKSKNLSDKAKGELYDIVESAKDARNKATAVVSAVRSGEASDPELNKALKQVSDAKTNLFKFLRSNTKNDS